MRYKLLFSHVLKSTDPVISCLMYHVAPTTEKVEKTKTKKREKKMVVLKSIAVKSPGDLWNQSRCKCYHLFNKRVMHAVLE